MNRPYLFAMCSEEIMIPHSSSNKVMMENASFVRSIVSGLLKTSKKRERFFSCIQRIPPPLLDISNLDIIHVILRGADDLGNEKKNRFAHPKR